MSTARHIWHWIEHRLHWHRGTVESCPDPDDPTQFFIYFQCSQCGLITGIIEQKYEGIERRLR